MTELGVELLPSMCKALGLISGTEKERKKEKNVIQLLLLSRRV
jgi:hypothetical protein